MCRVHGQRRDQRIDVLLVLSPNRLALLGVQLIVTGDDDTLGPQALDEIHVDLMQRALHLPLSVRAFAELLLRCAAIDGELMNIGRDLLLQTADPLHEELVQVRAGDGEKLHPFEQRVALVLRLVEHTAIECEPGQLSIEVKLVRA